jgi:hypothetical protein
MMFDLDRIVQPIQLEKPNSSRVIEGESDMKRFTALLSVGALALLFVLAPSVAHAVLDDQSINLFIPNAGLSVTTGIWGTVEISLTDATHAHITFTSDISGSNPDGFKYYFGDGSTVGLNVNGAFTLNNITGDGVCVVACSPPALPYSFVGSSVVSTFGTFNAVIDSKDGFSDKSHIVAFDLVNTSGSDWTLAFGGAHNVIKLNDQGVWAEGHIFVANADGSNHLVSCTPNVGGCPSSGLTGLTGFAAGNADTVPEPGTLSLLGSGLLLLGTLARRFRK